MSFSVNNSCNVFGSKLPDSLQFLHHFFFNLYAPSCSLTLIPIIRESKNGVM